jgi:predicted RNase H-like HicB family nuclease
MTIRTEVEKDGRWVATIPEVPGARGHGSTRLEAATGAAAHALSILKNESEEIWKANLEALEKMRDEVADDQAN